MSQDNEVCCKCGIKCGYDDHKGHYNSKFLCGNCRQNLASRFAAFFGIDGCSTNEWGFEVEWGDIDKILSNIKRDEVYRVSYIVTDKECYLRTLKEMTPIETAC